jgi:hypothetical protein
MNIAGHDIGVCSWSLAPRDTQDLISRVQQLGLGHIQLAMGPLVDLDDKRKHFELGLIRNSGLIIVAGMIGFPGEDYSTIAAIRRTGGYVVDDQWDLRNASPSRPPTSPPRWASRNFPRTWVSFPPPATRVTRR